MVHKELCGAVVGCGSNPGFDIRWTGYRYGGAPPYWTGGGFLILKV